MALVQFIEISCVVEFFTFINYSLNHIAWDLENGARLPFNAQVPHNANTTLIEAGIRPTKRLDKLTQSRTGLIAHCALNARGV